MLGELVHDVGKQPELYLGDVQLPEIIDQIAPWIVQPPDRGDKGDDAADLELIGVHQPAANADDRRVG